MKKFVYMILAVISVNVVAKSVSLSETKIPDNQLVAINSLYRCLKVEVGGLSDPMTLDLESVCSEESRVMDSLIPNFMAQILKIPKQSLIRDIKNFKLD